MKSITQLLEAIKAKPVEFLGYPKCSLLFPYIDGFRQGTGDFLAPSGDVYLNAFRGWLGHKYNLKHLGYYEILYMQSGSESDALTLFFQELDTFKLAHPGYFLDEVLVRSDYAPKDIYDALRTVRSAPGLYLGLKALSRLRAFIKGFDAGFTALHPTHIDMIEFESWLRNELEVTIKAPYEVILYASCGGDDMRAFDVFFQYLDNWIEETNQPVNLT